MFFSQLKCNYCFLFFISFKHPIDLQFTLFYLFFTFYTYFLFTLFFIIPSYVHFLPYNLPFFINFFSTPLTTKFINPQPCSKPKVQVRSPKKKGVKLGQTNLLLLTSTVINHSSVFHNSRNIL